MLTSLRSFDPITFLEINIESFSSEEISQLRQSIFDKMGEYIFIKLSQNLSEDQMQKIIKIVNKNDLLLNFKQFIPDLEEKIVSELNYFKKEFSSA